MTPALSGPALGLIGVATLLAAYAIGGIPWAYIIVKRVSATDVTEHGTGNVGAMNVRRSTGSWAWFTVAMVADASKGLVPVALARTATAGGDLTWIPMLTVAGTVLGHNYSPWMALMKRRFGRTGKGLATGGGALLAYDWRYFIAVLVVGLTVIALTRYMMAGQVAAAATLPLTAFLLGSEDRYFALAMGLVIYAAHHRRFLGLLRGQEPRMYTRDGSGPRG